jgi:hypothetical protein
VGGWIREGSCSTQGTAALTRSCVRRWTPRRTAAVVAAAEYMKNRLSEKHGLDTSDVAIEAES